MKYFQTVFQYLILLGFIIQTTYGYGIVNRRREARSLDRHENRPISGNEHNSPKSRSKRSWHSVFKPFLLRVPHYPRFCEFDPCEPPRGKYFVKPHPEDGLCYCYGKGQTMPPKLPGPHEWWLEKGVNSAKDPNTFVLPDENGKCVCTYPPHILNIQYNKSPYNDRKK